MKLQIHLKIGIMAICFMAGFVELGAQELFQKKYNFMNESKGQARTSTVLQTRDGGFACATYTGYYKVGNGILFFKTYKNGEVQWSKFIQNSASFMLRAISEMNDGGFCLTGYTIFEGDTALGFTRCPFLIKTDSIGNVIWTKIYGDTLKDISRYQSFVEIENGDIMVAVSMYLTDDNIIYKSDKNGNLLWAKKYSKGTGDVITKTSDGNIAVAGNGITKLDTAGNIIWAKKYSDFIWMMRNTSDGGFIASGSSVIKIDSKGGIEWSKRYSAGRITGIDEMFPGRYAVSGFMTYELDAHKEWLAILDSVGAPLKAIYPHACCGSLFSMKRTQDSGFIAEGGYGILGDMKMYFLKVDKNGRTSCPALEVPLNFTGTSFPITIVDTTYETNSIKIPTLDLTLTAISLIDITATDICTPTDILEEAETGNLQLYPNPASGICTILLKEEVESADVLIIDIKGATLYRKFFKNAEGEIKLDISPLQPGVYFVKVIADRREFVQKMIVE